MVGGRGKAPEAESFGAFGRQKWLICQLLCILQIHFVIKQHRSLQKNFNLFTA